VSSVAALSEATIAHDICALPLVRRLAAMLDRDPATLQEGNPLPRGWHPLLFNTPTPQSQLRADGAGNLGVTLPELGLPRLMLGGRQNRFTGDIPIGARVRRESHRGEVQIKEGRSGRFALVKVEHRVFVANEGTPVLTEQQDYILREAASQTATSTAQSITPSAMTPLATRTLMPDERLLFRYSAITDNPHRIHYDRTYAVNEEGYPALVVNGSIPMMFLLEMFRSVVGREPSALTSRNVAAMFCGEPLQLCIGRDDTGWRLWAQNDKDQIPFDARAE
jgi:3-methylfumaryl-CoA hydratase